MQQTSATGARIQFGGFKEQARHDCSAPSFVCPINPHCLAQHTHVKHNPTEQESELSQMVIKVVGTSGASNGRLLLNANLAGKEKSGIRKERFVRRER